MRTRPPVLLLLLAPTLVAGQVTPRHDFAVDRFGLEDGLPGSAITDLDIADDGRLWILASGRLTSFDGLRFAQHDAAQIIGSTAGRVSGLGAGTADTVWLTAGYGLAFRTERGGRLIAQHDALLRDVWQDDDGTLWLWDDFGILRFDGGSFVRVVALPAGRSLIPPDGETARSPVPDVDRISYVDPRGAGARIILGRWLADPFGFPANWPGARERGELLTVLDEGSVLRVSAGSVAVSIPDAPKRRPLRFDSRGLLWATSPSAIEAYAEDGTQVVRIPVEGSTIGHRVVREDARGNLWLSTMKDGLIRLRPLPVSVMAGAEGLTDGQIRQLSRGGAGAVLALAHFGDLYRTDGANVDTVWRGRDAAQITAALTDRRGSLWVATREGVRTFLNGRTANGGRVRLELPGQSVGSMKEDPDIDGLLWVLGNKLSRIRTYEPGGPVAEPAVLYLGPGVRGMLHARDGSIWITHMDGVTRWSADSVRTFAAEAGHPTGQARALYEDADGSIWIGRYFGGIVRYRHGRFDEVREADGLWEDVVNALLEDDHGNLWMAGNRGIHRVPRRALVDFIEGRIARVPGRGYGAGDGFLNPESSGGGGYRTEDGRLWFPTLAGLAVIDPTRVLSRERAPPGIRLHEVRAPSGTARADTAVRLARGDRRLEFAFGAVDLSDGGTHRYDVLLDGVDPNWVDVGRQRSATYTNVPPGRHRFQVRAVTAAGVRSAEPAVLDVIVPPYFHETRTFVLLALLLCVGVVGGGYHVRARRMRAQAAALRRLVAERTAQLDRARSDAEAAAETVGEQAAELRRLGEIRSRFFANVSHELRTPLTLVNGPLAEVVDGRFGETPPPVREELALVLQSGRRLEELVEQLLDVARMDSGALEFRRAPTALGPLLLRLGRAFNSLATARDRRLTVSIPPGEIVADVDPDQIEKLVSNLLSNAVKFTPVGGAIAFSVEERDGDAGLELVIRVEDEGPGIPPEHHDAVFERFQRRADESAGGGSGLGLALVREIAELHDGRVELRSAAGLGSCFTVYLPKTRAPQTGGAVIEPPRDTNRGGAGAGDGNGVGHANGDGVGHANGDGDGHANGDGDGHANGDGDWHANGDGVGHANGDGDGDEQEHPTVLIVEDHDVLRGYIARQFDARYRVVEARDGVEGLASARRIVPDLILCDIMMPGMDGDELCRAIRADPELNWIPVIMLTAKASQDCRLSALEGGADDYLVKPFDPEELRLRADNVLAGRKRHAEHLRKTRAAWGGWVSPTPRTDPDFADRLFALLRERAGDEEFGTAAMAKALAVSRSSLYRKVEEALGSSPAELLWTFRLEQAARWLRERDARVSDVAYGCGFRTVPHFTRKFKERYGTTPGAWRSGEGAASG